MAVILPPQSGLQGTLIFHPPLSLANLKISITLNDSCCTLPCGRTIIATTLSSGLSPLLSLSIHRWASIDVIWAFYLKMSRSKMGTNTFKKMLDALYALEQIESIAKNLYFSIHSSQAVHFAQAGYTFNRPCRKTRRPKGAKTLGEDSRR